MTDDLISRQAAIKLLEEWADGYPYLEVPVSSIARKLNELPTAEKKGKWIPVSERLPEGKDIPFLCVSEYNPIPRVVNKFVTYAEGYAVEGELVAALRKFLSIAIKCDTFGVEDLSKWMKYLEKEHAERNKFESAFLEFFRITAWMPLPEPYCGARMEE